MFTVNFILKFYFQPKKSKDSTKTTSSDKQLQAAEPDGSATPTSSQDRQNNVSAESTHCKEQGSPVSPVQSCSTKVAALGMDAEGALVMRDLETDGGEVTQVSDLGALPVQIQQDLVILDQENVPEENSLDQGAVTEAIPTADLLHLDEGVDQTSSQPPGESAGPGASLAQSLLKPLIAGSSSSAVSDSGIPSDRSVGREAHEDAERMADVRGENAEGASQALSAQRKLQAKPVSATVMSQVVDAGLSGEVFPISQATAPPPSFESVRVSPQSQAGALSEQNISAPTNLPLAPQAPMEAMRPPTAPQTQALTKKKSPVEAASSSVTHQPLYPAVPVLESPVEGKFQPMSTEQLQQLYYNPELQANDKFVEEFVLVRF